MLLVPALGSGLQARVLAATEALHWNTGQQNATRLYGEITVLATLPGMYYCGAQFDQGYTGIQHLGHDLHTALFSIWDTSPALPAAITQADPEARVGRFGGEGNGSHVKAWMAVGRPATPTSFSCKNSRGGNQAPLTPACLSWMAPPVSGGRLPPSTPPTARNMKGKPSGV
jgi:hypothetical protein